MKYYSRISLICLRTCQVYKIAQTTKHFHVLKNEITTIDNISYLPDIFLFITLQTKSNTFLELLTKN